MIKRQRIDIIAYVALVLATMLCSVPSVAVAALSGDAELGYVNYSQDVNGVRRYEGSSFKQRYSLLYETGGSFVNGRLGAYKISLGYEWSSIGGKIKSPDGDESLTRSNGHVLYRGDLFIDPQELPIRLRIFSRDLSRAVFVTNTALISTNSALIAPGLSTDIIDGTHISSGLSLELGVKSNMSSGYNSIFNSLPMIMVNYRDEINHDLKALNPVNTRLKNLAIVSLNKKDNWIHFSTTRYEDFIDKEQNFDETRFLLGTVSQGMQRKWVDFSNWIQVSADAGLTKRHDRVATDETYEINLFGIATRSKWEARSFNTFSRTADPNFIKYETRLPLYISGVWGSETDWHARFSSDQVTFVKQITPQTDTKDNLASLRIDTFKRSLFTLSQELLVDGYENGPNNNLLLQETIETASTRRFSSKVALSALYKIGYLTPQNSVSTSAVTQTIKARGVYTPINSLKAELAETAVMARGSGTNTALPSVYAGNTVMSLAGNNQLPSNGYNRFLTTARLDWAPIARLNFALTYENEAVIAENRESEISNSFVGRLDYRLKTLGADLSTRYTKISSGTRGTTSLIAEGGVSYTPNRNLDSTVRYSYNRSTDLMAVQTSRTNLKQLVNYYLYQHVGVARRILELNETMEYERLDSGNNDIRTTKSLSLGTNYFPLSRLYLAAVVKYAILDQPFHDEQLIYNGTIGFNYQKMQASLNYTYGKQYGTSDRKEKRFEANLKKFF